jgi:hypothetical protein
MSKVLFLTGLLACAAGLCGAAKPAPPALREPMLFNTPEADRILAGLQVFPADNPWNADISRQPALKTPGR